MEYFSRVFIILSVAVINFTCNEDFPLTKQDYPLIITDEVTSISSTGIIASAEIIGDINKIKDYGFILDRDENNLQIDNPNRITFDTLSDNKITFNYNRIIVNHATYFLRFFANTEDFLIYGNTVEFSTESLESPWFQKNVFPDIGRYGAVAFTLNNMAFVGTGASYVDYSITYYNDFWKYNPDTDIWTQIADFPGGKRSFAVTFTINNKAYVGSGSNYNDFWEYNPDTDSWTQIADFPGEGRSGAVAFTINNNAYVGSGSNNKDFWKYNAETNIWSQISDFPDERNHAVAFSINNKGYVGTGSTDPYNLNVFWTYEPETDTWNEIAEFPGQERYGAIAFVVNDRAYVGIGKNNYSFINDFWMYHPNSDYWTQIYSFQDEKYYAVSVSIENNAYIGLGMNETRNIVKYHNDFWQLKIPNVK